MKRYRVYVKNQRGEHAIFFKLTGTLETAKKYYLDADAREMSPIILAEEDMTTCEYRIKYKLDGKWTSTKAVNLTSEDAERLMLHYHSAHMEDYAKCYAKSIEDFGEEESIMDWIYNGNQEKFMLWLYDNGYI